MPVRSRTIHDGRVSGDGAIARQQRHVPADTDELTTRAERSTESTTTPLFLFRFAQSLCSLYMNADLQTLSYAGRLAESVM